MNSQKRHLTLRTDFSVFAQDTESLHSVWIESAPCVEVKALSQNSYCTGCESGWICRLHSLQSETGVLGTVWKYSILYWKRSWWSHFIAPLTPGSQYSWMSNSTLRPSYMFLPDLNEKVHWSMIQDWNSSPLPDTVTVKLLEAEDRATLTTTSSGLVWCSVLCWCCQRSLTSQKSDTTMVAGGKKGGSPAEHGPSTRSVHNLKKKKFLKIKDLRTQWTLLLLPSHLPLKTKCCTSLLLCRAKFALKERKKKKRLKE